MLYFFVDKTAAFRRLRPGDTVSINKSKLRSKRQKKLWQKRGSIATIEHAATPQERRDRALLAACVAKREMNNPDISLHEVVGCIQRIGRWGTCGLCPDKMGRDYPTRDDHVLPELCPETDRGDHRLDWTKGGTFHLDNNEVTREFLEEYLKTYNRDDTVIYEPTWFMKIENVAQEMVRLATESGNAVRAEVNTTTLLANQNTTPGDIMASYWAQINAGRKATTP